MDVGLIVWTERLAQGSKDPQFSAKPHPSQQSTSLEDHKHTSVTSAQRRAERSQREAGRPPLGRPALHVPAYTSSNCQPPSEANQGHCPKVGGHIPRRAGLGEAGRPHLAATQALASRGRQAHRLQPLTTDATCFTYPEPTLEGYK